MTTETSNLPPGADGAKVLQARAAQAYATQSRESLEEQWILDHLPMVRHIVQKVAAQLSQKMDLEDLISAGTLGLVKAARAFDPSRDAEFKTYAFIRIRGAVIDELRGRSFVPSAVHHQVRKVQQAYRELTASAGGKPPDDEELARALNMPLEQLYRILAEARTQHFLSIHGLKGDHPATDALAPLDGAPAPSDQAERKELLERLAAAIRELPQRDRLVLLLYYERDLTMKEIAGVLKITESRVSQLHASAVFKLSMKLRTEP